jgi:hypothetical protein
MVSPVLVKQPLLKPSSVNLTEKVPDFLDGSLIMALDLGSILAGTSTVVNSKKD